MKKFNKVFEVRRCFHWLIVFIALQTIITPLANGYYPLFAFIGLIAFGVWVQYAEENHLIPKNRPFFWFAISLSLFLTSIFFLWTSEKNVRDTVFFIVLTTIHLLEFWASIIEEA